MNFLKSPMFAKVFRVWIGHLHEIIVAFVEIGLSQCYSDRQDGVRVYPFAAAIVKIDAADIPRLVKAMCAEWYGRSEAGENETE